uniref:D-isomer specific 2-hydroxyacid dehydrogenase NAD-binding domain-containing protein n=1 Tax=Oryza punctata TaxID=4537 RepID=A0A0E0LJ59_ORYPU
MDIAVKCKDLGIPPVGDTGFGAIGVEIAKRLRSFGIKILATKRNWSSETLPCEIDELVDKKGGPEDMYEFAGEAEIVGIVDHKFLSAMKKGSYLVNIARGRILDYDAVFNHLKSAGLGIDVAWTEPYDPADPILKFSNVIVTPHIAGVTESCKGLDLFSEMPIVTHVILTFQS